MIFYVKPDFRVGPDKYLLRKAMLYISQLLSGIACVEKIPFKDVVIKMIIMKYLSIMSRTRMKATVITIGSIKGVFRYHFWASEVLGLFEDLGYVGPGWFWLQIPRLKK